MPHPLAPTCIHGIPPHLCVSCHGEPAKYKISYCKDSAGWWVATVAGKPGTHVQGESVEECRSRLVDLFHTTIDNPHMALFDETIINVRMFHT